MERRFKTGGLGILEADDTRGFTAKFTVNVPDPKDPLERIVFTRELDGEYEVFPDGRGVFVGIGPLGASPDVFVISDAHRQGQRVAKELFVMSGNLSDVGDTFDTVNLKRIP